MTGSGWNLTVAAMLKGAGLLAAAVLMAACGESVFDLAARGDTEALEARVAEEPELVNASTDAGRTPLHYAASANRVEVIRMLVEAGARLDAQDETGMTPLHAAAFWGRRDAAGALLEAGADLHARDHFGDTPLHAAAIRNRPGLVEYLIQQGADPGLENDEGRTPLEAARKYRCGRAAGRLQQLTADTAG